MNNFQKDPKLFEAFIKASQYLVRLKTQQNIREHLSNLVMTYFPASWTAFAQRDEGKGISIYSVSLSDELTKYLLTEEIQRTITEVLDSGFLATQIISMSSPSMTVFLPIMEEYKTSGVMLIGHQSSDPISSELLNIYLAIAGLAGETFERLHNELELNRHRTQLEELVNERTIELTRVKRQNELILNSVGEGIYGLDADGRINFVNPAALMMLGWKQKELIGSDAHDTFHHSHSNGCAYPVADCPVRQALKNGGAKAVDDEYFFRKDGSLFPVEFMVTPIKEEIPGLNAVVVFRDITERKKAEEAIKRSNQKITEILDSIQEDFYVIDSSWNFVFASRTFTSKIGKDPLDFVGHNIWQMFPKHLGTEYEKNLRAAMEQKEIRRFEISGKYTTAYYEMVVFPSQEGIIVLGSDITKRKQAEESLKSYAGELETANKELEAFSYSVSHDLRAPLRSITGFSTILLEDYKDELDNEGKSYLKKISDSGELMGQLMDDLLKLSRVMRSDLNFERINLSDMAHKIVDELRNDEPKRKVKVTIAPNMIANGDKNLLGLVLQNLLGNAWKYSSKTAEPLIEMGTTAHNGKQAYFVRDNGVGFDMTYADKLFKPFQRLHKATEFAGTGIGLATVQRIIRRHGGEVWAEGKVGEGATFYFTLA